MFGLHAIPTMICMGVGVALVALTLSYAIMKKHNPEVASVTKGVLLIIGLVAVAIGISAFPLEQALDVRDKTIETQLASADIDLISLDDWNHYVTVRVNDCTVRYVFPSDAGEENVWPLLAGTGTIIEGCAGQMLDNLFVLKR